MLEGVKRMFEISGFFWGGVVEFLSPSFLNGNLLETYNLLLYVLPVHYS
jgi:hypothetical protein